MLDVQLRIRGRVEDDLATFVGASVTFCVSVMGGCPALSIVASTDVVTGWSVPFTASTYAVRSAWLVRGSGSSVRTYGSRKATGPVISSTVEPQSPAFISGASGFQSTVQNDEIVAAVPRRRDEHGDSVGRAGVDEVVTSYSCTTIVPTASWSSSTPFSPDLRPVADALETEPRALARAGRRGRELPAIPPLLLGQVGHVGEVRPAVDVRIDAVGDEPGQDGGGERDGMPPGGRIADRGDRVARSATSSAERSDHPSVSSVAAIATGPVDGATEDRAPPEHASMGISSASPAIANDLRPRVVTRLSLTDVTTSSVSRASWSEVGQIRMAMQR